MSGGCSKHKYTYWASAGYGRNSYWYCALCRSLRTEEALETGAAAKTEAFLDSDDTKKALEALNKTSSVKTANVGQAGKMPDDELLSRFGNLHDLQDTDRLRDAIRGIMEGSVRAAASRYGLDKDLVFQVRLIIESNGLDAGVEKLLAYIKKRMAADEPRDKDGDAGKGPVEKFKALFTDSPAAD